MSTTTSRCHRCAEHGVPHLDCVAVRRRTAGCRFWIASGGGECQLPPLSGKKGKLGVPTGTIERKGNLTVPSNTPGALNIVWSREHLLQWGLSLLLVDGGTSLHEHGQSCLLDKRLQVT